MFIYCITNLINGRKYIGQTTRDDIKYRWKEHRRPSRTSLVKRAIDKYGLDSFRIEVVKKCNDIDDLNKSETEFIALSGTLAPEGYNLDTGGGNRVVSEVTKETMRKKWESNELRKQIARDRVLGEKNPNFGKGLFGEDHPAYGKPGWDRGIPLSEEAKRKISIARTGKAGLAGELNPMFGKVYDQNPNSRAVMQLSKSGEFIKEFSSIKLASEETGASSTHIGSVCKGKRNFSGGFRWSYK